MSTEIEVGTRVMYARKFLRSCAIYTGALPFAKGTVTAIESWGGGWAVATVDWGPDAGGEIPGRINVANLVREDRLHLEER